VFESPIPFTTFFDDYFPRVYRFAPGNIGTADAG